MRSTKLAVRSTKLGDADSSVLGTYSAMLGAVQKQASIRKAANWICHVLRQRCSVSGMEEGTV